MFIIAEDASVDNQNACKDEVKSEWIKMIMRWHTWIGIDQSTQITSANLACAMHKMKLLKRLRNIICCCRCKISIHFAK